MGARETFLDLAARGIRLVAQGDRLVVTPASLLTAEDRDAIRHYRDELLALLTEGPDSDHRRAGGTSATPVPAERAADPVVLSDWQAADRAYQRHAWRCPACSSAGRGYGSRCPTGAELWKAYTAQPGPATSKPERQPQPAEPPRHPFERERRNWTPATEPELRRMAAMLELLATEPRQRPEPKPARREYTPASDEELERMLTRWHRARAAGLTPDEADRLADRLHTRDREGLRDLHACLECRHLRAQFGGGWACRMWRVTGAADAALPREFVVGLHRCAGFDGGGT